MLQQKFAGKNRREDVVAEVERYPLMNEVWEDKVPRFDRITTPAHVVSSYSHTLHTQGTFRAWRRTASEEKWLRIHASLEWPDYYDEENVDDLRRFFDHYLKGEDNGWEETPRVRYSVLDLEGGDRTGLPAGRFPPRRGRRHELLPRRAQPCSERRPADRRGHGVLRRRDTSRAGVVHSSPPSTRVR